VTLLIFSGCTPVITPDFAGAAAAVAGLETALVILKSLSFQVPIDPVAAQGFALNRNLFAFQLVMAMSVVLTFALALRCGSLPWRPSWRHFSLRDRDQAGLQPLWC
jgi:hypothetical protein